MEQYFTITGMTCVACTKLTAKRIKAVPDVTDAFVDLDSKRATVLTNRLINIQEINAAFEGSHYSAEEYHD